MKIFCKILKEVSDNLNFYAFDSGITLQKYKRFAELAIMFGYVRKTAQQLCAKEEEKIRYFLCNQIDKLSPDRIFKNYYTAYHLILPYVSIRAYYQNIQLENCLKIIVKNKLFSSEIPPHRLMEWDHFLYKLNKLSTVNIPENSILSKPIYLQHINRDLSYALTHALFYCTDFGNKNLFPKQNNNEKLAFNLGVLIAKTAAEKDIDLLLELAINYFSMASLVKIDVSLLQLITNALITTKFVAFNLNNEQTTKKYHTLFVFEILLLRLHILISDNDVLNAEDSIAVQKFINADYTQLVIKENTRCRYEDCWQLIKSFKEKNIDFKEVENYINKWGPCKFLAEETTNYINHIKERAENDIFWNQESAHLGLSKAKRITLNNELINLLNTLIV